MYLYSNSLLSNKNVATSHMTTVIFEPIEQCSINIFPKKLQICFISKHKIVN